MILWWHAISHLDRVTKLKSPLKRVRKPAQPLTIPAPSTVRRPHPCTTGPFAPACVSLDPPAPAPPPSPPQRARIVSASPWTNYETARGRERSQSRRSTSPLSSQQRPSRAPHAWCGWQCACSRLAPLQLSCTNSFSAPSTCRQHVQCMCSGYVHALHCRSRSARHTAHTQRTQHARHLAHSAQHRHHSRTAPMCIQCMCMCMCVPARRCSRPHAREAPRRSAA